MLESIMSVTQIIPCCQSAINRTIFLSLLGSGRLDVRITEHNLNRQDIVLSRA